MASTKRTVIELSSGSDDDNPLVTRRRKIRRRYTKSQPQRYEAGTETADGQPTFAEFLAQALPRKLIASDVAEYIQRESNIRLETARQDGVVLDDVFIGSDCLPTWIGMQWDPEKESLHCAIQDRLLDLEVSSILGDVLRKELRDKANRKLEEARQLGVGIENITIRKGLLAAWNTPAFDPENDCGSKIPLEEQLGVGEELINDDMGQSSIETTILHPSIFSRGETPSSDISTLSTATAAPNSPNIVYDSSSTYDSCSDFSSSSGSSGSSTEDEEEFDDIIHMNNAVDPQPEYSESDDEAPHILHDVEIAGGCEGYSDIDLEIYLVEDDAEVEDLPELELAIDGDAFAYYFGDDGAVDVEIHGMDLRCSLDVPQDQSDEEGDYISEHDQLFEEEEDDDDDDGVVDEDEDEQSDAVDEDNAQDEGDTNAQLVMPMLQSEDEELNTGIEITEDGFIW